MFGLQIMLKEFVGLNIGLFDFNYDRFTDFFLIDLDLDNISILLVLLPTDPSASSSSLVT